MTAVATPAGKSGASDLSRPMRWLSSPWLWLVAVWAFLHGAALINAVSPVGAGLLAGPDSYMRLVRVEALLQNWDWFSSVVERSNAPFGETLHWTRLFDVIVLAFAAPLMPFMPVKDALFWGGAFTSPVLHLLLGYIVLRAAQAFDPKRRLAPAAIVAIGVLVQPAIFNYALPGRADHHVLIFILFAGVIWQMLEAFRDDAVRSAQNSLFAGMLGAAGLWASPELFSVVAVATLGFGLNWLARPSPVALEGNVKFAAGLTGGIAVILPIEHGFQVMAVEYDRISIVYLTVAAAILAGWTLVAALYDRAPKHGFARVALAAAGGCAAIAIIAVTYPKFFAGPAVDVDEGIVGLWLNKVQEMRSILPTTAKGLAEFVNFLGLAVVAVLSLALSFWRRPETRVPTVAVAAGLALMIVVSVVHARFSPYAEILAGIALVGLVAAMLAWRDTAQTLLAKTVAPIAGIMMLFVFPFVAGNALNPESAAEQKSAASASTSGCNIRAMSAWLNTRYSTPVTIMAMLDRGPALLWFTRHRVVATPYHRNHQGILAAHAVLSTTDDGAARKVLATHQANLLLLCPNASENGFSGNRKDGLQARLRNGQVPAWLIPVALPAGLKGSFKLFRVAR